MSGAVQEIASQIAAVRLAIQHGVDFDVARAELAQIRRSTTREIYEAAESFVNRRRPADD